MSTEFLPIQSILGGIIIGLATMLLLLFNGKISGISGVAKGLFFPIKNDSIWRIVFIFGLILGGGVFCVFWPEQTAAGNHENLNVMAISGLLVGIGTAVGGGCTSGHGICGISRLSLRSILATILFMISGGLVVFILRHLMVQQ